MSNHIDHVSQSPCPHCQRGNYLHASAADSAPPEAGDISLCLGCHMPGIFYTGPNGSLLLRKPDEDEWVELRKSRQIAVALDAAREGRTPSEAVKYYREHIGESGEGETA